MYYFEWLFGLPWYFRVYEAGTLSSEESSVEVMTRPEDHQLVALKCFISSIFFRCFCIFGGIFAFIIEMFHFSLILLDFFQKKIWIFAFIRVLCGGNDTARGWSSQPWPSVQLVALEIFQVLKQPGNSPPHSILSVYLTVDSFLQVTCSTPKYSLITTRWKGIVSEAYCSTASGCGIWLVPFGAAVVEPMEYEHEEVCRLQLEKVS